jgi:hypothetical protein
MRGEYTVSVALTGVGPPATIPATLLLLKTPSAAIVEVLEAWIQSEDGIAQQISGALSRVASPGSPAGSTVTPEKMEPGDQASGCTVIVNVEPTGSYDGVPVDWQGAPATSGYLFSEPVGMGAFAAPSTGIGLRIEEITTAGNFIVGLRWVEHG